MHYEKMYGGLEEQSLKLWIVLLLLLVPFVVSCRTTKATTLEKVNKQTNETETINEQHDSTTKEDIETNTSEQFIQDEIIDKTVEVIEWSTPDSLGNQYVVRTVRTTANIHREKRNDKQSTMLQTIDNHSKTTIHSKKNKSETIKTKAYHSEKTKTKTPSWVNVTILGIIIAVAIIVLLILKRYRIL